MIQRVAAAVILCLGLMVLPVGSQTFNELAVLKNYEAHRVSSYDRSGGNADGQNILPQPGETVILADLQGSGEITHIWVTIATAEDQHLRKLVLRMYWDGETAPSVETPIGDFFGLGHGKYYQYDCLPMAIGTSNGMNCFWPMPFSKSARITLTHEGTMPIGAFYYYVDYRTYPEEDKNALKKLGAMGRFHAQYHQEMPTTKGQDYQLLSAEGEGHYVGCNLSIQLNSGGWWGEGDDRIFVDGEETPSLHGTGSEDYFCGAWCYGDAFSNAYFGCPLRGEHKKSALWNVYRYHIEDPIPFKKSIRVMIEAIHMSRPEDLPDDYSSVAYWYQTEPHQSFAALPPVEERLSKEAIPPFQIKGIIEGEKLSVIEKSSESLHCDVQELSGFGESWSDGKQLWFIPEAPGDYMVVEVEVPERGEYLIDGYFTKAKDYGLFDIRIGTKTLNALPIDGYSDSVVPSGKIQLGKKRLSAGKNKFQFISVGKNPSSEGYMIGIDGIKLTRLR